MALKSGEGVPALQIDDVTGMSEEQEEDVIGESGRAPRKRAAEDFLEEQQDAQTVAFRFNAIAIRQRGNVRCRLPD